MKGKLRFIIICIFLSVVLAATSIFVQTNLTISVPKVTVYQATKQINIGDTITNNDMKAVQIDLIENSNDYVTEKAQAVGFTAKQTIYSNEKFNIKRLISKSDPNYFVNNNNLKRFSIPTSYIDDPYSLTFRQNDIVDIIFTPAAATGSEKTNITSQIVIKHATVVGAINENGAILTSKDSATLATAILFEADDGNILTITADQYKGKFKFIKYPMNQ